MKNKISLSIVTMVIITISGTVLGAIGGWNFASLEDFSKVIFLFMGIVNGTIAGLIVASSLLFIIHAKKTNQLAKSIVDFFCKSRSFLISNEGIILTISKLSKEIPKTKEIGKIAS